MEIEIKKRKYLFAHIIKTLSDVLKQEQFKSLNSIVGRHRGKDVLFVNDDHHFCFTFNHKDSKGKYILENGANAMIIPFINEFSVSQIIDCIKDGISFLEKDKKLSS